MQHTFDGHSVFFVERESMKVVLAFLFSLVPESDSKGDLFLKI